MGIVTMFKLMGNAGQVEYYIDKGYDVRLFAQKGWLSSKRRVWVIVRFK